MEAMFLLSAHHCFLHYTHSITGLFSVVEEIKQNKTGVPVKQDESRYPG